MDRDRKNWWLYGGFGALFLGLGITFAIESGFWKHDGSPWIQWVIGGIFGLSSAVIGAFMMVKAGVIHERMRLKNNKK